MLHNKSRKSKGENHADIKDLHARNDASNQEQKQHARAGKPTLLLHALANFVLVRFLANERRDVEIVNARI